MNGSQSRESRAAKEAARTGERLRECMELLGLPDGFEVADLRRAFHRKLFEVHPDTAGKLPSFPERSETPSALHVSELIDARDYLEQWILLRKEEEEERGRKGSTMAGSGGATGRRSDAAAPSNQPEDAPPGGRDGYEWYRQADRIFAAALEIYWRERLKYSRLPERSPVLGEFHGRLREARSLFARVLDRYPGGIWTPDAVEKIARINTWLGG